MKTLLFKKSLLDKECIEVACKRWTSCKEGVCVQLLDNTWKIISTSELYFWGVR